MEADGELAAVEDRLAAPVTTKGSATGSLKTDSPAGSVTAVLPLEADALIRSRGDRAAGRLEADEEIVERDGCVPKVLAKRRRTCGPHRLGRTIRRKVWSVAPR